MGELVDSALRGEPASRTIDLFGPPRRVVVVTTAPLESSGGRTAVAVVDDITERRHLEAVRTDFVANISHELKTPVGAIGLLAETLAGRGRPRGHRAPGHPHPERGPPGRAHHRGPPRAVPHRARARSRSPEAVAVDDIVQEAVERMRPAAEQAGISVVAEAVPDELVIAGDRRQLTSALSNLLDNAVKYSDPGGSVEVEAARRGRPGRDLRRRPRHRHPRPRHRAGLRALLPGRPGPQPPDRRHRPGPRHRPPRRRQPPRRRSRSSPASVRAPRFTLRLPAAAPVDVPVPVRTSDPADHLRGVQP